MNQLDHSEDAPPILVYSESKSGIKIKGVKEDLNICSDNQSVYFRKCKCNSSWCPSCGLPTVRDRMLEIYDKWDYRYVRTYPLTVDRALYSSPMEAFFEIQRGKGLGEFMKRLKKKLGKHGLKIVDYVWLLEWHTDGFPHWHCLVRVDKKGKAGRIADKVNLTEVWGKAKFIKEGYIKNQKHWACLVGYAAKHGYFSDGKKRQAELPDWVKEMPKTGEGKIRIKRMERMRRDLRNGSKLKRKGEKAATMKDIIKLIDTFDGSIYVEESGEFERLNEENRITWGECLKACGSRSIMTVSNKKFILTMELNVPYVEFKKMGGVYVTGQGLEIVMDKEKLLTMIINADELIYYNRIESDFAVYWEEREIPKKKEYQTLIPF